MKEKLFLTGLRSKTFHIDKGYFRRNYNITSQFAQYMNRFLVVLAQLLALEKRGQNSGKGSGKRKRKRETKKETKPKLKRKVLVFQPMLKDGFALKGNIFYLYCIIFYTRSSFICFSWRGQWWNCLFGMYCCCKYQPTIGGTLEHNFLKRLWKIMLVSSISFWNSLFGPWEILSTGDNSLPEFNSRCYLP